MSQPKDQPSNEYAGMGDRSLLRAPTDAAQAAAKDYWHNLHGEPPVHPAAIDKLEGRMLGAVRAAYAVDGLRGTACEGPNSHAEYQSLLATAEELAAKCDALREAVRALLDEEYPPSLIAFDKLRRVLRKSVEGEQRT